VTAPAPAATSLAALRPNMSCIPAERKAGQGPVASLALAPKQSPPAALS
jgi:hypothetical protein